jgi:hypothetical protein
MSQTNVRHVAPDARVAASKESRDHPNFDQGVVGKGRELFESALNATLNVLASFAEMRRAV